jgi:predicted short-subunit dehydrogenase-like oxidoreductase (DUF2520 family)
VTQRSASTFVVGAGPVATALAGALRLGGVPVLGLWARRPAAARAAAAVAGVAPFSSAPPDLLLEAETVIVAVRDSALGEVAAQLVATGLLGRRHVLLHCSGAVSAREAFGAVAPQLGGVGTMHPLRAITDGRLAMRQLAGTAFGVEGDERGRAAVAALVAALGGRVLALDGERMPAYHAACAFASNYVVAVLEAAVAAARQAGLSEAEALAAMVPLAEGALANVAAHGLAGGLTGPIRRGDDGTVVRHLEALAADGELTRLYAALGLRTAALAERVDREPPSADAIAGIRARLGRITGQG